MAGGSGTGHGKPNAVNPERDDTWEEVVVMKQKSKCEPKTLRKKRYW